MHLRFARRVFWLGLSRVFVGEYLTFLQLTKFLGLESSILRNYYRELDESGLIKDIKQKCSVSGYRAGLAHLHAIYSIVRSVRPRYSLEIGVGAGVSSTIILQAIKMNRYGVLYSLDYGDREIRALLRGRNLGWMIPQQLRTNWVLVNQSFEAAFLRLITSLGEIQFVLHDGSHSYMDMKREAESAITNIACGSVFAMDDAHCNNAFSEVSNKLQLRAILLGGRLGLAHKQRPPTSSPS
jgi:hypothetical protein